MNIIKKLFTQHSQDTVNPQTYWQHGLFAGTNSIILIYYGIQGVVHSVFPFWFPFTTSSAVIRSFKKLVDSKRHIDELNTIMPKGYVIKKHLN